MSRRLHRAVNRWLSAEQGTDRASEDALRRATASDPLLDEAHLCLAHATLLSGGDRDLLETVPRQSSMTGYCTCPRKAVRTR